jgi:hypothetical protein
MIKKHLICLCIALFIPFQSLVCCEVLTIAELIVDSIIFVDQDYIENLDGIKGGSQLVNYEQFHKILSETNPNPCCSCGGSAFNTIKVSTWPFVRPHRLCG